MDKICYFECFSGASGDMLLGALLGAKVEQDWFIKELKKIKSIENLFKVKISNVIKKGIAAVDVEVVLTHHDHCHRGLDDIVKIINSSEIEEKAKNLAVKIFTELGKAEAKVHNIDLNKIHFHEVGAIDSIIDIVGFSILFTHLNFDKVIVSPVNIGSGFVKCAHGMMPVPAPATLELVKCSSWPINNAVNIDGELLTPTGAAILSTIKTEYGNFPAFDKITSISYGAGKKNLQQIPNVIRCTIGKQNAQSRQPIWMIETNLDDIQPEFYDFIFEKLFNSGALDVFLTPVIMKKNRPANILSVICNQDIKNTVEKIIFQETSTFGIRSYKIDRNILNREFKKVQLDDIGEIFIKIGKDNAGNILSIKPEYEDCAKLAREKNISLKEIYKLAAKYIIPS